MLPDRVSANRRKPLSRLALFLPIAAVFALSLLGAHTSQARLHSGMCHIHWDAVWDFSDSSITFLPNGDLYWFETTALLSQVSQGSEQMYFSGNESAVMTIGPIDSTYGQLTSAPVDVGQYVNFLIALPDLVYVLRTVEGNYVKFKVHAFGGGGITIEFTYQDDGSRVLARPLATSLTTWGQIKSLYK